MKKAFLILAFSALFNISKSQNYLHFIDESKQWKYAIPLAITLKSTKLSEEYFAVEIYYFLGDTIINGFKYNKTFMKTVMPKATDTITSLSVYHFYEDTLNRKIFMYEPFFLHKDVLLYDFNLNEGDVVNTYYFGSKFQNRMVEKVDSIYLTNKTYKRITFTDKSQWIEGIGSTKNISYPTSGNLICVEENNNLLFLDTALFQNCDTAFTELPPSKIGNLDQSVLKTNIFPNPINKLSVLTIEGIVSEQFTIEIFNNFGILIKKDNFIGEYPIGKLNLINGCYFCRIYYKRELFGYNKLIIPNR